MTGFIHLSRVIADDWHYYWIDEKLNWLKEKKHVYDWTHWIDRKK